MEGVASVSQARFDEEFNQSLLDPDVLLAVCYDEVKHWIVKWVLVVIHDILIIFQELFIDSNIVKMGVNYLQFLEIRSLDSL